MDPTKFLEFAKAVEVSQKYLVDEETDCRTAIGRSQYSVFLEYEQN